MNPQQPKKSTKSANTTPGENSSNLSEKETKSSLVDPHLKTILPLIVTQLIPIQQVITDFAIVMLNNTKTLQNRINTLAKFEQNTTVEPNATELTVDNNTTYIPKSALIKTSINVSDACALANDTKIKELRTETDIKKILELNSLLF
jgi:hypothetical protein